MTLDWQLIWIVAISVGYVALVIPVLRLARGLQGILLNGYVLLSVLWTWSVWYATPASVETWRTVAQVCQVYGAVVLPTLLGMLTATFLPHKHQATKLWILFGATTLLALVGLAASGPRWPRSSSSSKSVTETVSLAGWIVLSGTAYASSWRSYHTTQRPLHRNRWRYWMLVLVMILLGDALFIFLGFPYNALGASLRWCGTALGALVLLSHYLPDLSGFARQSLRYLLLTLGTAGLFFGGLYLAGYGARPEPSTQGMILGTAGGALLLAILYPSLYSWARSNIDRAVFGKGYDREQILRQYNQGINNILELERLVKTALDIIDDTIGIKQGALLIYEESPAPTLRAVGPRRPLPSERIELARDNPFIDHLRRSGTPLSQYDLDLLPRFEGIRPEERAWLSGLDIQIYVPIRAQDQLLGIWALGAKRSGDAFTAAEVELLHTLAVQTTVTLRNARLVEDLKRLNADITRLNRDLSETNERLAILDKTKSDFISIASHELKTPLTQVRGYADILLEISQEGRVSAPSVDRLGQGIVRGAKRLQTIVDELLDVALIEAEEFVIHPVSMSLQQVMEQVTEGLETALQEREQTLTIAGVESLPEIMGDETRLHQAFRNIVANSIKFTPDHGSIHICAVQRDGAVQISIADTGIGIEAKHHELIFVKFYRVGELNLHSSGQTKFKGAGPGLGLPIAKGIIEAHGGQVWVESPGHDEKTCPGSTFHVLLPTCGATTESRAKPV